MHTNQPRMTLPPAADLGSAAARQQGSKWPGVLSAAGLPALASGQQPRHLAFLWAAYGEVLELTAGHNRLIAKVVAPPKGDADADVGHARKLRSYRIEAAFYRHYAPVMRADAARGGPAEGCAIAKPYLIQAEEDEDAGTADGGGGDGGAAGAPPATLLLLLLEDLRGAYPSQPRSYGLEDAKRALSWLACFHATWFESIDVRAGAPEAATAAEEERRRRRRRDGQKQQQQQRGQHRSPDDADPHTPALLWGSGCYWHLSTRQEELRAVSREWRALADAAEGVDDALRGFGRGRRRYGTLVHGDAKAANFLFAQEGAGMAGAAPGDRGASGGAVAAYDFQYVGGGYGPRDVAYLLASSVDERVLAAPGGEAALLEHYREALLAALAKKGEAGARTRGGGGGGAGVGGGGGGGAGAGGAAADPYPREALWRHYELSLLDLCRFEAGWGWWGAVRWAQGRTREILARLPEVLEAERRSVMAD